MPSVLTLRGRRSTSRFLTFSSYVEERLDLVTRSLFASKSARFANRLQKKATGKCKFRAKRSPSTAGASVPPPGRTRPQQHPGQKIPREIMAAGVDAPEVQPRRGGRAVRPTTRGSIDGVRGPPPRYEDVHRYRNIDHENSLRRSNSVSRAARHSRRSYDSHPLGPNATSAGRPVVSIFARASHAEAFTNGKQIRSGERPRAAASSGLASVTWHESVCSATAEDRGHVDVSKLFRRPSRATPPAQQASAKEHCPAVIITRSRSLSVRPSAATLDAAALFGSVHGFRSQSAGKLTTEASEDESKGESAEQAFEKTDTATVTTSGATAFRGRTRSSNRENIHASKATSPPPQTVSAFQNATDFRKPSAVRSRSVPVIERGEVHKANATWNAAYRFSNRSLPAGNLHDRKELGGKVKTQASGTAKARPRSMPRLAAAEGDADMDSTDAVYDYGSSARNAGGLRKPRKDMAAIKQLLARAKEYDRASASGRAALASDEEGDVRSTDAVHNFGREESSRSKHGKDGKSDLKVLDSLIRYLESAPRPARRIPARGKAS